MRKSSIAFLIIWTLVLIGSVFISDAQVVQIDPRLGGQVESLTAALPVGTLRAAGMTWVKIQAILPDFHNDGAAFIGRAHQAGFEVLMSVEGVRADPMNGDNQRMYLDYLTQLAGYGADAIEVWNEPNYRLEFNGSPQQYAALFRRARLTLQALYPDVLVISAGLMPTATNNSQIMSEADWVAAEGDLGAACVGIHYEDWPNTGLDARLAQIKAIYGRQTLCYTEVGVLSGEGYPVLPANFVWAAGTSSALQASTLHQIVDRLSGSGRLVILFNVGFARYDAIDPQAGYGIIRPGGKCLFCEAR